MRKLGGYNCKHSFSVFVPGASVPNYTEEELKELNAKEKETFTYNGQTYTCYEAMQHQREIERNIRAIKRSLICFKESGLEEDFKITSSKLNAMNREYKKFSQASGIRPKNERTQQVGFNRSISQQASSQGKKFDKENIK